MDEAPLSVLTKRNLDQIAADRDRVWTGRDSDEQAGAINVPVLSFAIGIGGIRLMQNQSSDDHYDYAVIGLGIGGLTLAALLAHAGKKVIAFEQHYVPGGYLPVENRKRETRLRPIPQRGVDPKAGGGTRS